MRSTALYVLTFGIKESSSITKTDLIGPIGDARNSVLITRGELDRGRICKREDEDEYGVARPD